jgi:hypothetical protein
VLAISTQNRMNLLPWCLNPGIADLSHISEATINHANSLLRVTAKMEFTAMKLNDFQESYSNYEPNKNGNYAINIQWHSTKLICESYKVIQHNNFNLQKNPFFQVYSFNTVLWQRQFFWNSVLYIFDYKSNEMHTDILSILHYTTLALHVLGAICTHQP